MANSFNPHRYPLSILLAVAITILCLIPTIPDTPMNDVPLMDKWTHFLMYGTLCFTIWWEHMRRPATRYSHHPTPNPPHSTLNLLFLTFLAPLIMGGLIELAQAYCTGGRRSGEWADFLANGIGVCLGNIGGLLWRKIKHTCRNNSHTNAPFPHERHE